MKSINNNFDNKKNKKDECGIACHIHYSIINLTF